MIGDNYYQLVNLNLKNNDIKLQRLTETDLWGKYCMIPKSWNEVSSRIRPYFHNSCDLEI